MSDGKTMKTKTKKKDLLDNLKKAMEFLGPFNRILDLLTDRTIEIEIKKLAKLRKLIAEIQFQLKMADIKTFVWDAKSKPIRCNLKSGSIVKIRPCSKEYEDKTYLGVYIGEVALCTSIELGRNKIIQKHCHFNPAIFVPDLQQVIYGCESFWGEIEHLDDLKTITDLDISNLWYVKAVKQLETKEK